MSGDGAVEVEGWQPFYREGVNIHRQNVDPLRRIFVCSARKVMTHTHTSQTARVLGRGGQVTNSVRRRPK